MRTIRKIFVSLLCMAIIATSQIALACEHCQVDESSTITMDSEEFGVVPYAEETTWYFRIYNGQLQQRLWSNTRGIWLTEWTNCND